MKVFLFIALILLGMLSADSKAQDGSVIDSLKVWPETEYVQAVEPNDTTAMQVSKLNDTNTAQAVVSIGTAAQENGQSSGNELVQLQSVQELTLYDDRAAVIGKLGEPRGVTQDEFYEELVIFEYEQVRVVFFGEFIQSIDIPGDVQDIMLDDRLIPATIPDLKQALGEPDYVAEDGIVFQRGEALLKLFMNEETGELDYISYYHIATV